MIGRHTLYRNTLRCSRRLHTPAAAATLFPPLSSVSPAQLLGNENTRPTGTYFVERSATGNLPVYSDTKGGGNKLVTEVRRVQGDVLALRNDLQAALPYIPRDNWKVLLQSRKIIIKGDAVKQVKSVLSRCF